MPVELARATAMVSAWTSGPTYLIFKTVGDGFVRHFRLSRWRSNPTGHNSVALEAAHAASNPGSPGPSPTLCQIFRATGSR